MKKDLVIFDIDGTLADNDHRVHHLYKPDGSRDWDAFFAEQAYDTLRKDVGHVYDLYAQDPNITIAVLTGRGEEWREVTENWLKMYGLTEHEMLVMRPLNDRTDDHILKLDQIKQWEQDGYNIIGFYDDRKRICDAAREHGITVFQMAEGNF